jgi:hypothetical protein
LLCMACTSPIFCNLFIFLISMNITWREYLCNDISLLIVLPVISFDVKNLYDTWTTIFMFSNKWNDQEYQNNKEDKSNIRFLFVQFAA